MKAKERRTCMGCGSCLEVALPIEPLTKRNVSLTDRDWAMLDQLVEAQGLDSKSAAVRQAIREAWVSVIMGLEVTRG